MNARYTHVIIHTLILSKAIYLHAVYIGIVRKCCLDIELAVLLVTFSNILIRKANVNYA